MSDGPRRLRRLLRATVVAAAVLAPFGAPARATPFDATLSIRIESAIGTLGAVSFVGSGSGVSTPTLVTVPSGIFAGTALLPVGGVPSLSGISFQAVGNRAGNFRGSFGFLLGPLPISGVLRLKGSTGTGPATLAAVPLFFATVGGASRGFGRGGSFFNAYVDVAFDNWSHSAVSPATWGKVPYSYHLAGGKAASRRNVYYYTTAMGSNARTPGGLGQLTLVSPIRIESNLPGAGSLLVAFGSLTLNFVPEPGTLLLLGAGAAALGFAGRRRRRL
jgi:hypothetical protein